MSKSLILTGDHPSIGKLFAAVDLNARYIQPKVSELRFAALLTPFSSEAEAAAALEAAGASIPGVSS